MKHPPKPSSKKRHPSLGNMTRHHLIPRERLKKYYGLRFPMPRNTFKLWEMKHAAWHALFGQRTISEIIRYLKRYRRHIYGYTSSTWRLLFKNKSPYQAAELLHRARQMKRKKHATFEFDPKLRDKIAHARSKQRPKVVILELEQRFSRVA